MELETTLVSENFNELQTALASLLADCDDVLSQSRLGPSSFLLSCCCFLFSVRRLLHCRANERSPRSMQNRGCCTVLSQQRTSDYMGIYSIFKCLIGTQKARGPVLSSGCLNTSTKQHIRGCEGVHILPRVVIHHLPALCTVHCLCQENV